MSDDMINSLRQLAKGLSRPEEGVYPEDVFEWTVADALEDALERAERAEIERDVGLADARKVIERFAAPYQSELSEDDLHAARFWIRANKGDA
jgi:hypothetical protein